jgi:hypothetical protein
MRERSTKDSSFPHWVALGSLVVVLALFFSNTVPALRERQSLHELQARLIDLRGQYERAIAQTAKQARLGHSTSLGHSARVGHSGGLDEPFDLQALLVAIDEQNATPLELWQRYQSTEAKESPRGAK